MGVVVRILSQEDSNGGKIEVDWLPSLLILGASLLFLIFVGVPIAFALGFLSVIALWLGWGGQNPLQIVSITAYATAASFTLTAVPLFILMAEVVMVTGISADAFNMAHKWLGTFPGGLAVSGVAGCAAFAAVTGSSVANTATIGLVAVPEMLQRGYNKGLATGCIAAGGALGILIPPSIVMIIYADVAEQSVGQLFFGGFIPGFMTAFMFALYIIIRCSINPSFGPKLAGVSWKERLLSLRQVWGVVVLAVLVLGSMYTGIATPTEAAGIGAIGAFTLALSLRKLSWLKLKNVVLATIRTTCMLLMLVIGGMLFSHVLAFMEIPQNITLWVSSLEVNRWFIMIGINLVLLALGCVIDPGSIVVICTPIMLPVIMFLGWDPVWFGIIFTMNMEMANITPPLGYNLFVIEGITPPEVTLVDIIRGIIPFLILFAVAIALVMAFPKLAMWLPGTMVRR